MPATKMLGHLSFSRPDVAIVEKLNTARKEFGAKHPVHVPTKLMLHPDNQEHHDAILDWSRGERLAVEVVFTNSVLPNHVWIGAPEKGSVAKVRVVESSRERVAVMAAADAPTVTERRIAIPVIDDTEIVRTFIALSAPALDAPKIAGLLLEKNPPHPDDTEPDDEGQEDELELAPMVLNREWVMAWQVVHAPIEANERAGISRDAAERNRAMLRSFNADAAKFTAPLQPMVRLNAPRTDREIRELMDQRSIAVKLPERMRRDRIRAMFERQMFDNHYWEIKPVLEMPAPHVVLPQEVTMHPRDVMRELAEQKKQPGALVSNKVHPLSFEAARERRQQQAALIDETPVTKPNARSSEDLLEEAAMDRTEITPAFLDDFMEALQYAVENRGIAEAGRLVDGHRIITLDRKGLINLWHPLIGEGAMQVAVRLRLDDPYRFVAKRHEVRAYLGLCKGVFAAKNITPIKAGELYDWEQAAIDNQIRLAGKKVA